MTKSKILIVEDDKLLSTTYSMFVEDLGYEVCEVCSTGEDAIKIITDDCPDLIIMDIYLAGKLDGVETAKRILEKVNIPIVYITSDEEYSTISRALAANSYGYLIKPVSKVSLGITIEQTLMKIKHDKEISTREQRYRTLIEDSPDAIIVLDQEHTIQYINFSGLKLFGTIHIEDILNKKIEDFFKIDQANLLFHKITKAFVSNEKIDYFPLDFIALNQREFLVGIVGSLIEFNRYPAIQLIVSNHTQRIRSEITIKNQLDIINNIEDGVIVLDREGRITTWNKEAEHIFGHKSADMLYREINLLFEEEPDFFKRKIFKPVLKKEKHSFCLNYYNKSINQEINVGFTVSRLLTESEISGVICLCNSVLERNEMEEALDVCRSNMDAVFNGCIEAVIIVSDDYNILEYNSVAIQYADRIIRRELTTGKSILDFLYFLNRNELYELLNNSQEGVSHFLERYLRINNQLRFFKINIYPVINVDGSIARLVVFLYDITKQKLLEKELEETKSELKPMFDSSIQRFYLSDLNYNLLSYNKAAQDIIQKEFNRVLKKGDNVVDFIPSSMKPSEFKELFERAKKGEHVVFKQTSAIEGEIEHNEAHIEPIINDKGEIYRLLIWTMDVTESEKNIQALKESEERYALVAKGGNDGIWDWDMIKDEVYLSPRWKAVLGYDEDEFISREDARDLMIHPDDIQHTKQNLVRHLNGETDIYVNEYRLKHKDNHYVWILERGLVLRNEDGKPYRMAGTITDITERKKQEVEIREANKALLEERSMFLIGKVVVFRINADNVSNVKYISENVKEILGYSADEFINKEIDLQEIILEEDKAVHKAERDQAMKEKKSHVEFSVYRVRNKNGKVVYLKDFILILYDKDNKPLEFLGYFIDVTKEKQAEKAIIENQQKYFTLFTEANDAIIVFEGDKIIDFNDKALELFKYDKNEFVKLNALDLSPENQPSGTPTKEKRERKMKEAHEGENRTYYWKYKRKDNELFDAEVSLSLIEFGEQKYMHAIIRDISERKNIEHELEKSKEKYQHLFDALPDMIFIVDKEGKYLDFKPDNYSDLIIKEEDVIGKNLDNFFIDEKRFEFAQKIKNVLENNKLEIINYQLDTNIGRRSFEARISKLNDNEVLVLVRDNTNKV